MGESERERREGEKRGREESKEHGERLKEKNEQTECMENEGRKESER